MGAVLKVVFAELKPYIRLARPGMDVSGSLEQAETSVLMLGETASFLFLLSRPEKQPVPSSLH